MATHLEQTGLGGRVRRGTGGRGVQWSTQALHLANCTLSVRCPARHACTSLGGVFSFCEQEPVLLRALGEEGGAEALKAWLACGGDLNQPIAEVRPWLPRHSRLRFCPGVGVLLASMYVSSCTCVRVCVRTCTCVCVRARARVFVNLQEPSEWRPLDYAAATGNARMCTLLLDHGASVNAEHVCRYGLYVAASGMARTTRGRAEGRKGFKGGGGEGTVA